MLGVLSGWTIAVEKVAQLEGEKHSVKDKRFNEEITRFKWDPYRSVAGIALIPTSLAYD